MSATTVHSSIRRKTGNLHTVTTDPQRFSGEWKIKHLGEIVSIRNQKVLPSDVDPDTLCIELDHIGQADGRLLRWSTAQHSISSKYRFVIGDVLFGRLRSYLRKFWHADRCGICTTEIWPLMVNARLIDSGFLYAIVQSDRFIEAAGISYGTHMPRADWNVMRTVEIRLPQLSEQRAIAEVLLDVDGLLAALETLIAKKRAIKRATMHQLLTGKIRLPGFSGEWRTKKLADLLTYQRPDNYIVQSTEDAKHGEVPVLTANKSFVLHYTDEEFGVCSDIPAIIFDDFTTDCKYVTFPFKVKSSAIKLLYARHDRVSLRYVYERMELIRFPLVTHKRFYISEYQNIEFLVPSYDEQVAIVSALFDMDAEIVALERRRNKTKSIKQGMMQQLLTGRVRLMKPKLVAGHGSN